MNTSQIKNFAIASRNLLKAGVIQRFQVLGFDADGNLTEKPEDFDAFMESVPNKALLQLVNAFSALNISGETHLKN